MAIADMPDVVVIGGGPGGYEAAIRVTQLGGKVMLIERERIGGVCVNRGCIPTKTLLESAEMLHMINKLKERSFGIAVEKFSIDFEVMMERKNEIVEGLADGMESRLDAAGIKLLRGTGTIAGPGLVEVQRNGGSKERIECESIIIATGAKYTKTSILGVNEEGIITSNEALELEKAPKSILIYGSDYIGIEFSTLFNAIGTDVALIETAPHLLPSEDEEIANLLREIMEMEGMNIFTEAKVEKIENIEGQKKVTISTDGGEREIKTEKVFVSPRPVPRIEGLGLDKVDVKVNEGKIMVNGHMETNVPGIYAVGNVVGKFHLSHVASAEGIIAAESAMGMDSTIDYKTVPRCIFSIPQLACVGLTEKQARERGYDVKTATLPFFMNAKAHIHGEIDGVVKIVADAKFGEVLGMHILGPDASGLIAEGALAIKLEATVEEIANTIHAHPTLPEAVRDAARELFLKDT